MMPHSVQVSFSGDRREAEGEAAYWGILRELGERGQACQLDFFMGEFADLCALFLLFSHFFSVFFLFCVCVLFFLLSDCRATRSSFVAVLFFQFNWSLTVAKISLWNWISLSIYKTRDEKSTWKERCALPFALVSLKGLPGPADTCCAFFTTTLLSAFLPARFPFPASFAATNR